jgi:hypothetical protein
MKNYKIYEIIWHRVKDDSKAEPVEPTYHTSYILALNYKSQREANNKERKHGENHSYHGSMPQPKFVSEEEYKSIIIIE